VPVYVVDVPGFPSLAHSRLRRCTAPARRLRPSRLRRPSLPTTNH